MLTALLAPLAIAGIVATNPGPSYSGVENRLQVAIPRLEATIQVDGDLSEPVWTQAARLTDFSEYAPDDGRRAENETEILVWYSPTAINFGIRAHAAPGTVRATLADRDHIDNDDWIQIYLATFNDGRQASVFGVNPLGVQLDGAVVEGTSQQGGGFGGLSAGREEPDLSPDFVFDSKGRLTDYGYEVEVRIPFKSLRYQPQDPQSWGLHVIRRIQSSGHEDSWAPARRSAASFIGQAGTLVGLSGLHRGLVMDLNPVVIDRVNGSPGSSRWTYDGRRPEFGGNVRWGVTPNLTLNATVNPDFSQVEADASQFQYDPRQALFFDEKRPFFLDGIEFFSAPNNLIYSRRIVEPVAATKLTGKIGGTTVAVLSAADDESESIEGGHSPVFNIMRVQRDFGGSSRAAVLYAGRLDGDNTNHVAAADTHMVWRRIYALDLQLAASQTSSVAGSVSGPMWYAALNRRGHRFTFRYSIQGLDPKFQDASGFIGRPDIVHANVTNQVSFYGGPGARLERVTGDVVVDGIWRYEDFTGSGAALERKLHLNSNFFLRGGWHAGASVLIERFAFDTRLYESYRVLDGGVLRPFTGRELPNLDYVVALDTPRVKGLSVSGNVIWGRDENFYEWSSSDIVLASGSIQWRPTERLRVDASHRVQSYGRRTDGTYAAIRRIPRVKVEYQATRAIFLRWVGELDAQYQDDLRDDSRTNLPIVFVDPNGVVTPAVGVRHRSFRNDWLFSYQPNPGTVLFAGYGATLADARATGLDRLRRTADGFFVKISYLFRL